MITKEQAKEYFEEHLLSFNEHNVNIVASKFANHCINEYKESLKEEIDILKYNIHSLNKSGIIIALDSLLT